MSEYRHLIVHMLSKLYPTVSVTRGDKTRTYTPTPPSLHRVRILVESSEKIPLVNIDYNFSRITWDEAMEKVLEERKDVWQALADYDRGERE
jgi:hypothetical protein